MSLLHGHRPCSPAQAFMNRFYQFLLITALLMLSWLGMMAVHEFGHCAGTWISGGAVSRVVLHPLAISCTDLARNPHPLFVAWGGAVVGTLLPLIILLIVRRMRFSFFYIFQFFAGFCLVANGAYLAGDAFFRVADGNDIIRHGSPAWMPVAFGIAAAGVGLYLWNGLGPYFGLGKGAGAVDRKTAVVIFITLVIVVIAELIYSTYI